MEADSTTFDSNLKDSNSEPAFPFPVSPRNYQLYSTFATHSGKRSLEWQIVEKLQAHGLLPNIVQCPTGKPECKVACKNARVIDKVQWVCEVCGTRQPVRLGSFFLKLQCSLLQALQIILAWSEDADCVQAAQHFGVKDRVANAIYNKMDDLAIREHRKSRLGGENSVVLAEMYPDCVNRLSPDTTDTPHVHRILMLADTNHIPTRYWLHVLKEDGKKNSNSTLEYENMKAKVEEVVKTVTLPNSTIVSGSGVPPLEGAATTQHLLQHCDADMQHFCEHTGFVRVGPKGYFLPDKYKQEALNIYTMDVRSSDIFVASYPRSGTTWTQELVWMVANDLNYEKSDATPLTERYPFLEFSIFVHPVMKARFHEENSHSADKLRLLELVSQPGTQQLAATTAQRFIKTHLPMSLLPPTLLDKGRMVYVARDPRDVAVSFYHLNRLIRTQGYIGDFKMYWNFFINDLHHWTPYFEHLKEAWEKRHHPHMLFLFYEELTKDLPAAVKRVADFLGKHYSEEEIAKLCEHLSINSFKNNKSVNYDVMKELGILIPGEQGFIRKGQAGGWREHFDADMARQADQWIADNLKDSDFRFPHFSI